MTDKEFAHFLRCGWLEPEGKLFECKYEEHKYWANKKYHSEEKELEKKGYIKITFSIFDHTRHVYCLKKPTKEQEDFLLENNYTEEEIERWY